MTIVIISTQYYKYLSRFINSGVPYGCGWAVQTIALFFPGRADFKRVAGIYLVPCARPVLGQTLVLWQEYRLLEVPVFCRPVWKGYRLSVKLKMDARKLIPYPIDEGTGRGPKSLSISGTSHCAVSATADIRAS